MAEGGGDFGDDDPDLDYEIDNDDDDDHDEQEVNRTQPFQPGAASTPYHGGEEIEMQTRQHEKNGLPNTSYDEDETTPLLGAQSSWNALTSVFPEASATDLDFSYSKTGRLQVKMFGAGKKLYNQFTKDNTGMQQLNPSLTKEIKTSLGPRAEEIIAEDRDTIREQRQRLTEAENQLKEAEALAAEREKEQLQMKELRQKTEQTQARIDALQSEQGTNVENEAEIQRLKLLKKKLIYRFRPA